MYHSPYLLCLRSAAADPAANARPISVSPIPRRSESTMPYAGLLTYASPFFPPSQTQRLCPVTFAAANPKIRPAARKNSTFTVAGPCRTSTGFPLRRISFNGAIRNIKQFILISLAIVSSQLTGVNCRKKQPVWRRWKRQRFQSASGRSGAAGGGAVFLVISTILPKYFMI